MRLLVLGGTQFLGRATVEAAVAAGHEVTMFNRGRTNAELFPEVERLVGDRDGGLSVLAGRTWDAVIDPSGYVPRLVRDSAAQLRESVGHYVFVSSISVYADPLRPWAGETASLKHPVEETEEVTGETYGGLKVACENVVRELFAGAYTNVRSGLIVGPHDPTGRFTYWPVRVARGGEVLAPGDPDRAIQFADARDLGAWLVRAAAQRVVGDLNASGPEGPCSMGDLLASCRTAAGSDANFVWMSDEFLLEHGAGPWMELPLWLAPADAPLLQVDVSRAVAEGLRFRPLEETIADTLSWAGEETTGAGELASGLVIGEAGMAPEKEAELLAAWRSH